MHGRTRRVGAVVLALWAAGAVLAPASAGTAPEFVLSPEGNHLWIYDTATGEHQLLARAVNGGNPGAEAPNGLRRDINGQVCTSPDGTHIITGEDTVLADEGGGDGGSSHDPRIAGWGYFRIQGDTLGQISIEQVGKLAPEAGRGPGYTGDPDNYGCGFLDASRLFTTAIGNTLPGEDANGQLLLWFGPFEQGFREEAPTDGGAGFLVGEVDHCQIDDTLATAGGLTVAPDGTIYVATNRPDDNDNPGAIWRFSGTWPTSFEQCTPEFVEANITKELLIPSVPGLPADVRSPTPSAVLVLPGGNLLVSSVFSGTVSEYTPEGDWVRDVYPLSPVTPPTGPTTQTPFGLARTSDGSLWIADLGIAIAQPAPGQGSLIRVRYDGEDPSLPAETVRDGLTFPDGLGVYRGTPASTPAPTPSAPSPAPAGPDPDPPRPGGGSIPATGAEVPVLAALLGLGMAAAGLRLGRRASR